MNLLQFKKRTVVSCERCGQELTDPESIARGLGPECALKTSEQFAAITDLTLALTTGYFDQIAQRYLIEKSIVEARLLAAKQERNSRKIVLFTKALQKITGILVSREMQRLDKLARRKAVA